MADNVVGGRPSASGQNAYNAGRYKSQVSKGTSWPGKNIFEDRNLTYSGSSTVYVRAKQTAEHPDIGTLKIRYTILANPSAMTSSFSLTGEELALTHTDTGGLSNTFEVVSSSTSSSVDTNTLQVHYTYELNAPVGEYTMSWSYSENGTIGSFYGASRMYINGWNKGQTDIPADALIKVWQSDFSDYEAPQAYEDGLPISLSESGLVGWEDTA